MSDTSTPATPESVAAQLKVLAHPARLQILQHLGQPGKAEASVSEIYVAVNLPQAVASQHLIILKDRGVLASRKQGTKVYYSVALPWCLEIVKVLKKQAGHAA